jgi:hypothetical protein
MGVMGSEACRTGYSSSSQQHLDLLLGKGRKDPLQRCKHCTTL